MGECKLVEFRHDEARKGRRKKKKRKKTTAEQEYCFTNRFLAFFRPDGAEVIAVGRRGRKQRAAADEERVHWTPNKTSMFAQTDRTS